MDVEPEEHRRLVSLLTETYRYLLAQRSGLDEEE
jgi:hypothetical protein